MFAGEEEKVTMRFSNDKVGVVVDRFGKDIIITKCDQSSFQVTVSVNVSPQFMGWVFALGEDVKILSPSSVVTQFKNRARKSLSFIRTRRKGNYGL